MWCCVGQSYLEETANNDRPRFGSAITYLRGSLLSKLAIILAALALVVWLARKLRRGPDGQACRWECRRRSHPPHRSRRRDCRVRVQAQ